MEMNRYGVSFATNVCFLPLITPLSRGLLSLHVHYKNGVLPLAGGLLNQPNGYIRAMEIIEQNE